LITVIAVIVCLVLLVIKLLADSSEKHAFLHLGRLLVWFIVPLVMLFIVSIVLRIAVNIPNLPLIF
jgi:hypothetical protein